ncbi:MAG: KTSC domain-containing protein, partial [Stenotrophomonas maltophilia]
MAMRIDMQDVESSQIHSIGHDPATNTLAVRFYRGSG